MLAAIFRASIFTERLGRRSSPRLILEIGIRERLPVVVPPFFHSLSYSEDRQFSREPLGRQIVKQVFLESQGTS
jgi:hypothetical protein